MNLLYKIAVLAILFGYLFISIGSARRESLTYDEIVDIEEGINIVTKREFLEPYNPPFIRILTAVPLVAGLDRLTNSKVPAERYFPARAVTIGLGLLLLLAVWHFTRQYFGNEAALIGLFLMALEPNFLGHSHYITMDVGVALLVFLSYLKLLELRQKPTAANFLWLGIFSGLALASKIS